MSMRGFKYNGAQDRISLRNDEKYIIHKNGVACGTMMQHDLFDPIPKEYLGADYIVVDPPYNKALLKGFYTKADMELDKDFEAFLDKAFDVVKQTGVEACYMEFGKQGLEGVKERMERLFPYVRVIQSKYYNKYPCYFVIGETNPIELDAEVKDELKVIDEIISKKDGKVLDFCNGRGAVSSTAFKHDRNFVCTELNINRLAVAVEKVQKAGATITRIRKDA